MLIIDKRLVFFLMGKNAESIVVGISERLNVLYEKNWTKLVTEQLKHFERAVIEYGKSEGPPNEFENTHHWTFGGALLYSVALLTTVGELLRNGVSFIYWP